jgi:hypothetical protein
VAFNSGIGIGPFDAAVKFRKDIPFSLQAITFHACLHYLGLPFRYMSTDVADLMNSALKRDYDSIRQLRTSFEKRAEDDTNSGKIVQIPFRALSLDEERDMASVVACGNQPDCYGAGSSSKSLISCPKCEMVLFCSTKCIQKAEAWHAVPCELACRVRRILRMLDIHTTADWVGQKNATAAAAATATAFDIFRQLILPSL